MTIETLTDKQLQVELERREKNRRERNKPQQLETVGIDNLRKLCQEYIDKLYKSGYASDDFRQCIFEAAVEAVFGKSVWEWIREQG